MALAYSVVSRGNDGGELSQRVVDVTLDAAYAAGGYALSTQSLGLGSNGVIKHVVGGVFGGFLVEWDFTNNKLKVRDASGLAGAASPEVPNNDANINGVVARLVVFGTGQG